MSAHLMEISKPAPASRASCTREAPLHILVRPLLVARTFPANSTSRIFFVTKSDSWFRRTRAAGEVAVGGHQRPGPKCVQQAVGELVRAGLLHVGNHVIPRF